MTITRASVCMAVYNGSKYIRQQIESILSELGENDELLISDDFSSDNTEQIVNEFLNDVRVKFIKNSKNLGLINNFESVLKKAKGEYIYLCDQDDVWLSGKLDMCIEYLQDNILLVSDCTVVDSNLNVLHPSFFKSRNSGPGLFKNIWKNSFLGCCMAFRKDLLDFALPIPQHAPMHDMWLGLVAETKGKVIFLPVPLVLYRRHDENASPTSNKSTFGIFKQIKIRINLSFLLGIRVFKNLGKA